MFDRSAQPLALQLLAAVAAVIGFVGYHFLGWRFGEPNGPLPYALGVGFAAVAVGWTLYSRFGGGANP